VLWQTTIGSHVPDTALNRYPSLHLQVPSDCLVAKLLQAVHWLLPGPEQSRQVEEQVWQTPAASKYVPVLHLQTPEVWSEAAVLQERQAELRFELQVLQVISQATQLPLTSMK
jgi:hypothetical protein